jgi:hypothetical protein
MVVVRLVSSFHRGIFKKISFWNHAIGDHLTGDSKDSPGNPHAVWGLELGQRTRRVGIKKQKCWYNMCVCGCKYIYIIIYIYIYVHDRTCVCMMGWVTSGVEMDISLDLVWDQDVQNSDIPSIPYIKADDMVRFERFAWKRLGHRVASELTSFQVWKWIAHDSSHWTQRPRKGVQRKLVFCDSHGYQILRWKKSCTSW